MEAVFNDTPLAALLAYYWFKSQVQDRLVIIPQWVGDERTSR
jgi:hypothetical protein